MIRPWRHLVDRLPASGRRAGKWVGGGVALLVLANEVRGVLVVAAIIGEMWRNLPAGG